MKRASVPRRPPYWTLVALPVLLWLPFQWAVVTLIAATIAKAGIRRRALRGRRR